MMMRKFGLLALLVSVSLGTSWAVEPEVKTEGVSAPAMSSTAPLTHHARLVEVSGFISEHPSHEKDYVILSYDTKETVADLIKRVQPRTPFEIANLAGGSKDPLLSPDTLLTSIQSENRLLVSRTIGGDGTYNARAEQKKDEQEYQFVLFLSVLPKNAVHLVMFTGNKFTVAFQPDQKFSDLKASYSKVSGIPTDQVRLVLGQKEVADDTLLSSFPDINGKNIGVVLRLKGPSAPKPVE